MRSPWPLGLLLVTSAAAAWLMPRQVRAAGRPDAPAVPATLAGCIDHALEHNPRLAMAHSAARAADAGTDLAKSAGGLHASLSGEVRGTSPTPVVQLPGEEPREVIPALDASLGLAVEVPLDTSHRIRSERQAARAPKRRGRAMSRRAISSCSRSSEPTTASFKQTRSAMPLVWPWRLRRSPDE